MPESYTFEELTSDETPAHSNPVYSFEDLFPEDKTLQSQLAVKIPEVAAEMQPDHVPVEDLSDAENKMLADLQKEAVVKEATKRVGESPIMGMGRGIRDTAIGAAEFARSPQGLGLAALSAIAPPLGALAMGGLAAQSIGEASGNLSVPGLSPQEVTKNMLGAGLMAAGAVGAASALPTLAETAAILKSRSILPRSTQEVANTIKGDIADAIHEKTESVLQPLREQSTESPREVPAIEPVKETGIGGEPNAAEEVPVKTEQARILLKPEEQAIEQARLAEEIGIQKVESEVKNVAQVEGQRPAKEVKSELVSRLEDAVSNAPNENEGILNLRDEYNKRPTDARREQLTKALNDYHEKVTIEIPGDGTFKVWNTKESLGQILNRAKRIDTAPTKSQKISYSGTSALDRAWIEAQKAQQTHELSGGLGAVSTKALNDIRERFSPIERKDSSEVARNFVDTVQAGTKARTVVRDFMRRAFKGGDSEQLAKDFVDLGRDNRRLELQTRGIPASQVPALTPAEAAAIRAKPEIQRAIKIWNSEIAPAIEEIRTRNGMIMSPSWKSMDLMLNLPAEYNPAHQSKPGVNVNDVFNKPAVGEGSYQTDPVETLTQIVRGHMRYDSTQKLAESIRKDVSIPPTSVVDPSKAKLNPTTFPAPYRGELFEAKVKGHTEKVVAINLKPDAPIPDMHYVPKRIADAWNKLKQERGNYDSFGDKVMNLVIRGILPGTFMPHVIREIADVGARIAQSGQNAASMLPSWLGSNELAIRRMAQMKDTMYGQLMQRMIDLSGSDRGVGYGIKEAKTKLGKILNIPHELLFNPDFGVDVLARRAVADAHLRMKLGNKSMDQLEKSLNSGTVPIPQAMQGLQSKLGDVDVLALGRRVNNTLGYGNPQTRTQALNWAQRIFPFISSESGKIPNEIRRLVTLNVDVPALKGSVARGQYGQAAKQIAGMMAQGAVGVYILQNALNYMTTRAQDGKGHFMWDNPEGHKTDVALNKDWYWSNLDPGLARAARITGVKEKLNRPEKVPDVSRELVNEAFSVLHPAIRLAFAAFTQKELFLDKQRRLLPVRRSDLVPIGPVRNTIDAASSGKPVGKGIAKDVASLAGVQIQEAPRQPALTKIRELARDFMKAQGKEPEVEITYSPDAPHSKLRQAILNQNDKLAMDAIQELRKGHSDTSILRGQIESSRRAFTSTRLENKFKQSLSPQDRTLYDQAKAERAATYRKFLELWRQRGPKPEKI